MADARGVLVIGELADGGPSAGTLELLAAGRHLSQALSAEPLGVLLAGVALGEAPKRAIAGGADTVYAIESPVLEGSPADAVVAAAEQAVRETSPRYVLGARSPLGADVMPRLAFRLGTALAQDCLALEVDAQKRLVATRPVYGGNALATLTCVSTPAVASVRPRAYEALEPDPGRDGRVEPLTVALDESTVRCRLVERVERPPEGLRLEDARVVVAGGRGLGGPEPFHQLEELASLLHGKVGASRAVCDAGWAPPNYQIGLTGKTVSPDLYITVGISGASQHLAGCSGARAMVAINKDPGANIFREARYGVAGDWRKVLPAFIEQLRELVQ